MMAHEQGVHRDLKPANVVVSRSSVKVLDFGLAKVAGPLADTAASGSMTRLPMMTEPGLVLGTASYMSPEQATGVEADRRSDIRSFGCVLYEIQGQRVEPGNPVPLFATTVGSTAPNTNRHQYAVAPDGRSFLLNAVVGATNASPIGVILNWTPKP